MSDTLSTILHAYQFDVTKPAEKAAYTELKHKLATLGLKCFETHGGGSHYCPDLAGPVELETRHLFDNQWNTAPIARATSKGAAEKGARVFDWAQDSRYAFANATSNIKRGHWLEQTPAMREARRNTVKCGYCGHQEAAQKGAVFCSHCMDSEYLTEADALKGAVRMVAIDAGRTDWQPMTEAEAAHYLPQYREAQTQGSTARGKARLAKARADVAAEYAKAIDNAEAKRAGAEWIMDNCPGMLANYIYYTHTATHCFGWRKPLADHDRAALAGFPFEWKEGEGV